MKDTLRHDRRLDDKAGAAAGPAGMRPAVSPEAFGVAAGSMILGALMATTAKAGGAQHSQVAGANRTSDSHDGCQAPPTDPTSHLPQTTSEHAAHTTDADRPLPAFDGSGSGVGLVDRDGMPSSHAAGGAPQFVLAVDPSGGDTRAVQHDAASAPPAMATAAGMMREADSIHADDGLHSSVSTIVDDTVENLVEHVQQDIAPIAHALHNTTSTIVDGLAHSLHDETTAIARSVYDATSDVAKGLTHSLHDGTSAVAHSLVDGEGLLRHIDSAVDAAAAASHEIAGSLHGVAVLASLPPTVLGAADNHAAAHGPLSQVFATTAPANPPPAPEAPQAHASASAAPDVSHVAEGLTHAADTGQFHWAPDSYPVSPHVGFAGQSYGDAIDPHDVAHGVGAPLHGFV